MVARSTPQWIPVLAVLLLSSSWLLAGGALAQSPGTVQTPLTATCANPTVTITSAVVKGYTVTINGGILTGSSPSTCFVSNSTTWGDGNSNAGGAAFPDSHTYALTGSYTIKVSVTTYNLTTGASGGGSASTSVTIHGPPYTVDTMFDQSYHLPGDASTLFVSVINSTTTAPQSNVGSFFLTSCYITSVGGACQSVSALPVHPAALNLTSFSFTVPPNALPGSQLHVNVEVNATLPTGPFSENGSSNLTIASPMMPFLCASPTSSKGPCVTSYPPGEDFILSVAGALSTPSTLSGYAPWANAFVKVVFYLNNNRVSPTNFPASLTTNGQGVASAVVETSGMGPGSLNITATIQDYNATPSLSESSTIFVQLSPVPSVQVQVTLGYSAYYGGDTLNANYALSTYSGTAPLGWTVNRYQLVYFAPGVPCLRGSMTTGDVYQILAYGTSVSGAHGAIPPFSVPTNLQGSLDVIVYANNATQAAVGETCALVSQPTVEVQPSETYYNAGDHISVSLTPKGSIFNGATYFAEVSGDYNGNVVILYNNSLGTSTSFGFSIPTTGTLPGYVLTVAAETSSNTIISSADIDLTEFSGYSLEVSLVTKSSYSDGSFQPGNTITLAYTVTPLGLSAAVQTFWLSNSYDNPPTGASTGTSTAIETSAHGTVSVTIPSTSGDGVNLIYFSAAIPVASGGQSQPTTLVGVLVKGSPSPLDYEVFGAGTSFNVTELLVIAVLVVAAVLVTMVWRRRRRGAEGIQPQRKHRFGRKKHQGVEQWPEQQPAAGQQPPAQGDYSQTPPPVQPYGGPPPEQQTPGLPGDQSYNYPQ